MIYTQELAKSFRIQAVRLSHSSGAAHLASALSCIDIIAVMYGTVLRINPDKPNWKERDRFILSKGHAASALYIALAHRGLIKPEDLAGYGKRGTLLEQHPTPFLPGVEAATGSLGHGLPLACGMSLAARITGKKYRTFVLMGDGECNEGAVWEAAMFAGGNRLGNLGAFVDYNKWQATGRSNEILALKPLADKFSAFGWTVHEIDGHCHREINKISQQISTAGEKPILVIAHTIKGKGVSFMEDDNNWHYRIPTAEEVSLAEKEIIAS